ncbi:unnamed protein product [Macrosiphum euphorbiae]|uniref:Uncharacterized protein n=1 Tax=Macrosiphum euphorbiae TaxID=13131 RepID=A0AAV0VLU2_9HEMI|nr:unnamed protein product [Macrosiphum euphorbiae]
MHGVTVSPSQPWDHMDYRRRDEEIWFCHPQSLMPTSNMSEPVGARHYRLSYRICHGLRPSSHPSWCHRTIGRETKRLVWWYFHLKPL